MLQGSCGQNGAPLLRRLVRTKLNTLSAEVRQKCARGSNRWTVLSMRAMLRLLMMLATIGRLYEVVMKSRVVRPQILLGVDPTIVCRIE